MPKCRGPSCSLVFWLMDAISWVFSISSNTSLNVSLIALATLVLSHSPRIFHRQSIKWVLICSSCSTEQPLVCCTSCWWSCSTYRVSMTSFGAASSLLKSDWILEYWCDCCLAVSPKRGTGGGCDAFWKCDFCCDWLPFGTLPWE